MHPRGLEYTNEIDYIHNHLDYVEEASAQSLKNFETHTGVIEDLTDRDGSIKTIDNTTEAIRRADFAVTKANQLTAETLDVVFSPKVDVVEEIGFLKKNGEAADAELEFWRAMKQTENGLM